MRKIIKYELVEFSNLSLMRKMDAGLEMGWQPFGSPILLTLDADTPFDKREYAQAMVLYEDTPHAKA